MRPLTLLLPLACALLHHTSAMPTATFKPVKLSEPLNWIAGPSLFPSQIIAGYNAPLDQYDAASWGEHVLSKCKEFSACTSAQVFQGAFPTGHARRGLGDRANSFAATNSGSTGGRFWFGYVFRGGPTDESFYEREEGVTDSAAWSM